MDKSERKRLKKLGKEIVAKQSAERRELLSSTNPAPFGSDQHLRNEIAIREKERASRHIDGIVSGVNMRRDFIVQPQEFDLRKPYLAIPGYFWECRQCDTFLPTQAIHPLACTCGNIGIDGIARIFAVRDEGSLRLVRLIGKIGLPTQPDVTSNESEIWHRSSEFDLRMPQGWSFLASASQSGIRVFQSADGQNRLTVSYGRVTGESNAHADLLRIFDVRRRTEMSQSQSLELTKPELTKDRESHCASWRGYDPAATRHTATLVMLRPPTFFVLYLEMLDSNWGTSVSLESDIFGGFQSTYQYE